MSTLTNSQSIVKTPNAQSVKEAIEINESNIAEIVSHYNTYAIEADDTDVSAASWVLDEDTMTSNSNTKVPTQQSVKAYADLQISTGIYSFVNKTFDVDAAGNSLTNVANGNIKAGAAIDAAKIADGSVSNTEFQYISTLSANAQTQIDSKLSASSAGVVKGWIHFDGTSGSIGTGDDSFNVTSVTDNDAGDYTVTWDTDFANANYAVVIAARVAANTPGGWWYESKAVGSVVIQTCTLTSSSPTDNEAISVIAIGDR